MIRFWFEGGFFDFFCEECVAGEYAFDYGFAVCRVVVFGCHGLPPLWVFWVLVV